jgi:hypothetical protein
MNRASNFFQLPSLGKCTEPQAVQVLTCAVFSEIAAWSFSLGHWWHLFDERDIHIFVGEAELSFWARSLFPMAG